MEAKWEHESGFIKIAAPSALVPGQVVVRPKGIAIYNEKKDAAAGEEVTLRTTDVYTCEAENTDTWADGDLVYWDDSSNNMTTTSTDNTLAGKAVGAKVSGATKARIDINAGGLVA